jgi:GxxExxY protein
MTELLHKALTASILRAYYDVYNGTSRIYPERFYDRAMMHDLNAMSVVYTLQPEWQVLYKEKIVGKQILDILIAGEVVIENKAVPGLTRLHKAQLLSYLKATGKQVGLLLNFGGPKPEFERLYFAPREPRVAKSQIERAAAGLTPSKLIDPRLVYEIVGGLFDVHATLGPGFIHRIYANACYHELKLRSLPAKPQKAIQVFYRGTILGELKFGHLRVGGEVLVFPAAIQNPADLHPEMLCDWLRDQQIPLGIVANFHDTALTPTFLKPRSA